MRFLYCLLVIIALLSTGCARLTQGKSSAQSQWHDPVYAQPEDVNQAPPVKVARPLSARELLLEQTHSDERRYLDSLRPRWHVASVNLTQLLLGEIRPSYEIFFLRMLSAEGTLGIDVPLRNQVVLETEAVPTERALNHYPFAWSYYGSLAFKVNFITLNQRPLKPFYLAVAPFLRYSNYTDKAYRAVSTTNTTYSKVRLETASQHQSGVKFLLGVRLPFGKVEYTRKAFFDFYAGVGYRFNRTQVTTHGGKDSTVDISSIVLYDQPVVMNDSGHFTSFQFGAKLSFAWAR